MPFKKGQRPWNLGTTRPSHLPTEKPTLRDIAWAAGVCEGEGTCGIRLCARKTEDRMYQAINMRVSQKDSWLCKRLQSLFGGSCAVYHTNAGSLKNPEERRDYWRWDLTGSRALGFLQTIYVFLSPRRQLQIRQVLDGARRAI